MDWNAHLTELAMLRDSRERLDGIVKALLDAGNCFAIETHLPAEAADDQQGQWYIWTTKNGAKVLMESVTTTVSFQAVIEAPEDPLDSPPVDHGTDRYDYVEIQGAPEGVAPSGEWWEQVLKQPCADCRANLFVSYRSGDPTKRSSWTLTLAHDDGCPRLHAEGR